LVEAALGGEDGDVAVVARACAAAHLAGPRKISPESGVVAGRFGEWVLRSWGPREHDYMPPRLLFLLPKKKRARSDPTQARPRRQRGPRRTSPFGPFSLERAIKA